MNSLGYKPVHTAAQSDQVIKIGSIYFSIKYYTLILLHLLNLCQSIFLNEYPGRGCPNDMAVLFLSAKFEELFTYLIMLLGRR